MKTSELKAAALDWAVAKCEGVEIIVAQENWDWYSSSWEHGGPIIERDSIAICHLEKGEWRAQLNAKGFDPYCRQYGPTPLMAAMRCYVASKMGDEVEIPGELK
jgi:hypothetical protein